MLTTIEATYDNGQIIWNDTPPAQKKSKVLITFLEEKVESEPMESNVIRFGSMKGLIQIGMTLTTPWTI